ncbi:CRISPR-associated protein Csx16 [Ectothiorhodospira mobilis]|uniref:CRISPR-associated protein Csx16 n=1 Tax=Ectothiorhodospira mobilis TaxID=195064 RepID=UPI001902F567|nr:CRISPR-associated protein Csx16 [Ectothiorhodospira mobilis]MBK1692602.1 CRISPR-associated protein Csx16 [Ectothiorhodospira mobilis]
MTPRTYFVSRHPGAMEWAARHGIQVDQQIDHLDVERIQAGDTVIGTLPVHLAARVCQRGGRYLNLSIDLPPHLRGRELSADDLEALGARVQAFHVQPID